MAFPPYQIGGLLLPQQAQMLANGYPLLQTEVNAQPIVRFYIGMATGFGHQASTINLVRRLAAPLGTSGYGFGFANTIEIWGYMSEKAHDETLTVQQKIFLLLPELADQPQGPLNNATIELHDIDNGGPTSVVPIGFCGGMDTPSAIDFNDLKSLTLVLVQPYKYSVKHQPLYEPGNVFYLFDSKQGKYAKLNLDTSPDFAAFRLHSRAYHTPIPDPTAPQWQFYIDGANRATAHFLTILRALNGYIGAKNFSMGIIYGVNYPNVSVFRNPQWNRLALGMASYWRARKSAMDIDPPVFINFGSYIPAENADAALPNVAHLGLGDPTAAEAAAIQRFRAVQQEQIRVPAAEARALQALTRSARARARSFDQGQDPDRYTAVDVADIASPAALSTLLDWVSARDYRVLFIQGGFVPPPVFNYLMKRARLPAIFEGNNTAAVAINTGLPYFNTNRPGGVGNTIRYPEGYIGGARYNLQPLQNLADQIQSDLTRWPTQADQAPSLILADGINALQQRNDPNRAYFRSVYEYYQHILNDKFTIASTIGFQVARRIYGAEENSAVAGGPPSTLDELYTLLESLIADSSTVDVLSDVFASGPIHDNYIALLKDYSQALVIDRAAVTKETESGGATTSVTLSGASSAFLIETDAALDFTMAFGSLSADAKFSAADSWNFDGAPWIIFKAPSFHMLAAESGTPPAAAIETKIPSADADVTVTFPYGGNQLEVSGSFDPPKTIADFLSFAGGIDLNGMVPGPVQALAGIGVKKIDLTYDSASKSISQMTLLIGTTAPWPLINKLEIQSVNVTIRIDNPGDMANRKVSSSVNGILTVDAKAKSGIEISATYPGLYFSGQLYGSSLSIDDLIGVFWPGAHPAWPGGHTPEVTAFSIDYDASDGGYSGDVRLDLNWPIVIAGTEILDIQYISLMVSGGKDWSNGSLSGSMIILPNSADIGMTLSALYLGSGKGWKFQAQQTSGQLQLAGLVTEYLHWDPGLDLAIDGLSLTVETEGPSFEFSAKTAKAWQIPISTGISITGAVTIGYGSNGSALGVPEQPAGRALVPILTPEGRVVPTLAIAGAKKRGFYGRVSAEIIWQNIDITFSAELSQSAYTYTVTWGFFTGTYNQKTETVEIKFKESTSLGAMVETFVSWLTGSKFGLGSPWDLLNKITLSNFSMTWNFKTKKVSFTVDIGPIELGIARITGVTLVYEPEGKNKGVNITLDGEFRWQQNPSEPLGWNAADPSSTKAPPGQGNKYFDLRLLAGGQHVSMPGVPGAETVQDAIAAMAKLEPPKSGEVPAIGFDASNNWLFGLDLSVMRIEPKSSSQEVALRDALQETTSKYVLTLQIVFDDPVLYGLRIALEGEAAKVFAGLDFQIMYERVSDNLGVYRAELTLPTLMRRIDVGAYSLTLPTFGVEIYTNGDFQFDIGFPWNENFARSFTVEAIVPPGIPLTGSGGFYFGKLPAIAVKQLPKATNGSFNPNIVFGFGAQVGLGKSIEYGILSAGFSLTVFGIIEGILAKWNPYDGESTGGGSKLTVEGEYFFWLQGTFGLIGRVYGSVNFVVIKAEVNLTIKLYAQITFASYEPIPITVYASVDASASLEINLGFFKITLHFSFSVTIKETFTIGALQNPNDAPWQVEKRSDGGRLTAPLRARLGYGHLMAHELAKKKQIVPNWGNLSATVPAAPLTGYVGFGLTAAGDRAFAPGTPPDLAKQLGCYAASLFIESTHPAAPGDRSGARKAAGVVPDTPFEALAKMVARWAVSSLQDHSVTPGFVDTVIVTDDDLVDLIDYLAKPKGKPIPITGEEIEEFLTSQFVLTLSLPTTKGEATAAYFPAPPLAGLSVPAYGKDPALGYTFADFNTVSDDFLSWLHTYFNQLAVQVEQEQGDKTGMVTPPLNAALSVGSFIFTDYFTLIMRQMLQAFRSGLRDFKYELRPGETANHIVSTVNQTGELDKIGKPISLYDLFAANDGIALTAGKALDLPFVPYTIAPDDGFDKIAGDAIYSGAFNGTDLATLNADLAGLLAPGAKVTYGGTDYTIDGAESLNTLATSVIEVTLAELLASSDVLTSTALLQPAASLQLPPFPYQTKAENTLLSVAAQHGIEVMDLAGVDRPNEPNPVGTKNGDVGDLFDVGATDDIDIAHLPQYQVGALIEEAQRSGALQHISGMVSRYYFHGLRLPTEKITPKTLGMWVTDTNGTLALPPEAGLFALTGQQFPIPSLGKDPLTVSLTRPKIEKGVDPLPWLKFTGGGDQLDFTVTPPTKTEPKGNLDYQRIEALLAYATKTVLDTGLKKFGAESMVDADMAAYPLSSAMPWQSATTITFPAGGSSAAAQPRLWPMPSAMQSLPDPNAQPGDPCPSFALEIQRYDEATGETKKTPIDQYGWGSSIGFTIKKLPDDGGSAAYATTYEIVGAGANDTIVLERIVERIRDDDSAFQSLILGYETALGGSGQALVADAGSSVTMGISQVNLSTVTRPSTTGVAAVEIAGVPALLNKPSAFVRLLWEASITRAGGFFLYYYDSETGAGLPDALFDEKGEATVRLLAFYTTQDPLTAYMNVVATGDPLDLSSSAVIATAVSRTATHPVDANDTISAIAQRYYTTVLSLVTTNPVIELRTGAPYTLSNGTYMVSPTGAAPGGQLADIAKHFKIDANAITAANPRIPASDWQTGLAPFTAIRLPTEPRTVGTDPGGSALADIATFYGTTAAALAGYNAHLHDLLKPAQTLTLKTGPIAQAGTPITGIQQIGATRAPLPKVPASPSAPTYAADFLVNLYTMLAYQVLETQDFVASNVGLPLGPKATSTTAGASKVRAAKPMGSTDPLEFAKTIPYTELTNNNPKPAGTDSPYGANGRLLQIGYDWNDLYGNRLVTKLDEINAPVGATNGAPILVGYTDKIVALGQWPSIAGSWSVKTSTKTATDFTMSVELDFDPGPFNPAAGDKTNMWQHRAKASLVTVTTMIEQFTDPNGIAFWFDTTLLSDPVPVPKDQIEKPKNPTDTLVGWLIPIQTFLQARTDGDKSAPEPKVLACTLSADAAKADATTDQVFLLSLSLRIERPHGVAEGDFASMPAVRSVLSKVAAKTEIGKNPKDALKAFATAIEGTLSVAGKYTLTVATGPDRFAAATEGANKAIWGVRLGAKSAKQGIAFSVNDANAPEIYAPAPVSNQLVTRSVTVHSYAGIGDFDPKTNKLTGTEQDLAFNDIDLDVWVTQFFRSFDTLLSPNFMSSILVVDKRAGNLPKGVPSLLSALTDQKEALAKVAADLMTPVYVGQATTRKQSATDALHQNLLVALSNLYSTRAAVSFGATVIADIGGGTAKGTPGPQLFGNINWTKDNPALQSQVTLSAPKLDLRDGDNQPITFLVEAPQLVHEGSAGVVEKITLDLAYSGSAIEHQVAKPAGIEKGYVASSWLQPVMATASQQLSADLGTVVVPMILRGFPDSPRMSAQDGVAVYPGATDINDVTLWTYDFSYDLDFHYEQDKVYCEIEYNIQDNDADAAAGLSDAFQALAQFITVAPALEKLVGQTVPGIDAATTDQKAIDDAAQVLGAYLKMVADVADQAAGPMGLRMLPWRRKMSGTDADPYKIAIEEKTQTFNISPKGKKAKNITAWVVTIQPRNGAPVGLDANPHVLVDGYGVDETHLIARLSDPKQGRYAYYYKNAQGILRADTAQSIGGRTLTLPGLQILARQDVKSTVHLTRNEGLVKGEETDRTFVYTTPEVSFSNPYHPRIDSGSRFNIAELGSPGGKPMMRSLPDHLTALFKALFENRYAGDVTIQMDAVYRYAFNSSTLGSMLIPLPVALQPPLDVAVGSNGTSTTAIAEMVNSVAGAVNLWFTEMQPSTVDAELTFSVTIMANLTRRPMPLLSLSDLFLDLADISPPLGAVRAAE